MSSSVNHVNRNKVDDVIALQSVLAYATWETPNVKFAMKNIG